MEFYRITSQTLPGYLPLLPEELLNELESSEELWAIGAVDRGVGCGVLVFRLDDIQAEILWLAVAESWRRKGCATGMVRFLCQYAERTTTPVTCSFAVMDKSEPIYQFFRSLYFFSMDEEEGRVLVLPAKELNSSPLLNRLADKNQKLFHVFELPHKLLRSLLPGELQLSVREEDYIPQLCLCTVENETVTSAVLFQPGDSDEELYLAYAFCRPEASRSLLAAYARAAELIVRDWPQCRSVRIAATTPAAGSMAEKLFPQVRQTGTFYRACWDMRF